MNRKPLEFFNANSYYSFFIDPPPLYETPHISSKYLSKFEEYCKQGDIHALDALATTEDPVKSEANFLNGLLLTIKYKHRNLFQILIEIESYKGIILRHLPHIRNVIFHHGQLKFLMDLQRLFHQEMSFDAHHTFALQLALHQLQTYYHTRLRTLQREVHIKNIKDKVAQCYQKQKAFFLVPLPLEYDAFLALKNEYSEPLQQQIEKAYKNHPIHKLWRLLHPNQFWFEDPQEYLMAKSLEKNQWLIILMWLAASDDIFLQNEQVDIQTIDDRVHFFFENLSILTSQDHLLAHLFQAVIAHPLTLVLTKNMLSMEHEQFITNILIPRIQSLPKESLSQILHALKRQDNSLDLELKQLLHLHPNDKQDFFDYMNDKWGAQWSQNTKLQHESDVLLNEAQMFHDHQKTLIALLKSHHQHDFQTLSFFYNNTTKSSSPKTNDLLLPLS